MRPGHIEIFAADPLRSMQFYKDILGFELTLVQDNHLVWLKKGDLEILLRPGSPAQAAARYEEAAFGFVLYTDDLDSAVQELQSRGLEFKGTVDSEKCLTFTDPDGNWFQLVNPNDH